MIISASRRTDIPAFYFEWFIERLKEGYVIVQNPINKKQFTNVSLKKEDVDIIVFWSKNPQIKYFDIVKNMCFEYYLHFTITPYDKNIEVNLPNKKYLIDNFTSLSSKIGKEKLVWRYDPIILSDELNINYHKKHFEYMAKRLSGYTEECIISFVDIYAKMKNRINNIFEIKENDMRNTAYEIVNIATKNGIILKSCCEPDYLKEYNIGLASCIDKERVEKILKKQIKAKKDYSQRKLCNCIKSIDIGSYDSCINGCKYCYANKNDEKSELNMKRNNIKSPILIGNV